MLNRLTAAGASPQTVRNVHAVLRRALNQAVRWGVPPRNVAALVEVPRQVRYEAPAIAPEQARAIMVAMSGDRLEAVVTLTLATGLRQGEALGLRWSDVDLDGGSLTVRRTLHASQDAEPSTRSRRRHDRGVRWPSRHRWWRVCAATARQADEKSWAGSRWHDEGLVFTSSIGTPLMGADVTRRFQSLLAAAGQPRLGFHDLRHGCASLLLAQGVHPRVVMDALLGAETGWPAVWLSPWLSTAPNRTSVRGPTHVR